MEESGKQTEEYTGDIVFTYHKDIEKLKQLWEDAFGDPIDFVEYYFSNVCENNKVLSAYAGGILIGMIHLNPYNVLLDGIEKKSYYVVGVAVEQSMRRRGIMKSMMKKALSDLADEGIEFVYLMPELEEYYSAFGFRKIYSTKTMDFTIMELEDFGKDISDCYASLMLCTEHMTTLEDDELVLYGDIINQKLSMNYRMFCKRDRAYLKRMLVEHSCQGGDVCVITERMMCEAEDENDNNDVVGVFSYGIEDDTMYVERFEPFVDNSMALMISVLKLATELSCSRCIITVAEKDVDGYEHILDGIELDVTDGKGIMACILKNDSEKYLDIMKNNTFIDEIV